jgi:putative ABC transport system substrate-binding protein
VIGFLSSGTAASSSEIVAAFHRGLSEGGFVESRNVAIDYRFAEGRVERLPGLAADLVRRQVTVIVAVANASAVPAKAASASIPIVFVIAGDPIRLGLVASLNRPGGNATGMTNFANVLVAKQLELLHEIKPTAILIAYLLNPDNPNAETDVRQAQAAAHTLGVKLVVVNARSERDVEQAFASFVEQRAGALLVAADPAFIGWRAQISALAARHALPAIYPLREFALAGGLMSYGTNRADTFRQAGIYAARILKGEKPADLPVVQPTRIELVINLKAARTLGLTIPPSLVLRADETIP